MKAKKEKLMGQLDTSIVVEGQKYPFNPSKSC